jgi:3-phosphoshikimate 1-carboxyvinyltransferase
MIIRVSSSTLAGEVQAPPSKSVMQRLVAGALLADGTSTLDNISQADDCTASLMLAAQLGAEVEIGEQRVSIAGTCGKLMPRTEVLTPGESGLAARLFTPIAGLASKPLRMEADGTLVPRPMAVYESLFEAYGGQLSCHNGAFPIEIARPLLGGEAELEAPISSQFITGLLFALPNLTRDSELKVTHPTSIPYLEMTLEVLEDFGISITANDEFTHFQVDGDQQFRPIDTVVDGDWSGAAALAVAGMLCAEGSIAIHGLQNQYTQADEAIRGALLFAGGALSGIDDGIQVAKRPVRPFSIDLTDSPDLFPVLAALAAFGKKPSTLKGIHRLEHKESHRARRIAEAWEQFGIQVDLDVANDWMRVHPWPPERRSTQVRIDSSGDHRMVMALSILGMAGNGAVEISRAGCVAKSYPEFFDDLETLGARLTVVQR